MRQGRELYSQRVDFVVLQQKHHELFRLEEPQPPVKNVSIETLARRGDSHRTVILCFLFPFIIHFSEAKHWPRLCLRKAQNLGKEWIWLFCKQASLVFEVLFPRQFRGSSCFHSVRVHTVFDDVQIEVECLVKCHIGVADKLVIMPLNVVVPIRSYTDTQIWLRCFPEEHAEHSSSPYHDMALSTGSRRMTRWFTRWYASPKAARIRNGVCTLQK